MRLRRLRKPCPGCGEQDRYRKADEVCDRCKNAIRKWTNYTVSLKQQTDAAAIGLKGSPHWYPRFYFGGPRCHIPELDEMRSDLSLFFAELIRRLCVADVESKDMGYPQGVEEAFPIPHVLRPGEDRYIEYPASRPQSCDSIGFIDRRTLELIRGLWDRTARFADLAYTGGVQDGKNLLLQLASGEMSQQDFAEYDVRLAKKRQEATVLHEVMKGGVKCRE